MGAPDTALAAAAANPLSLAMDQAELIRIMAGSIYPGAADESIALAIGYCRALNLDPMQKPVHIMQVSVKTGKKDARGYDEYAKRDVILPGIGLYRTMAARTGVYAGITDPEFGPNETLEFRYKKWEELPNGKRTSKLENREITFPLWCKVTVKKIVAGIICEFTATEYWLENYATAGRDTDAPNEMWQKRTRGQLAKCAEAQALRKAFPDVVGSLPTAEEMEGKVIDQSTYEDLIDGASDAANGGDEASAKKPRGPRSRSAAQQEAPSALTNEPTGEALQTDVSQINRQAQEAAATSVGAEPKHGATDVAFTERDNAAARKSSPAGNPMSESMLRMVRTKAKQKGIDDAEIAEYAGTKTIESIPATQVNDILSWIASTEGAAA